MMTSTSHSRTAECASNSEREQYEIWTIMHAKPHCSNILNTPNRSVSSAHAIPVNKTHSRHGEAQQLNKPLQYRSPIKNA